MTKLQDLAADGAMAHVMRLYIEWLAPQMDTLPTTLAARFKELRAKVQEMKVGHNRAPGTIAHPLIGYEYYMRFLLESGIYETKDPAQTFASEMAKAIDDIIANSRDQGEEGREERPGRMFLNTIGELLLTKAAAVIDLTSTEKQEPSKGYIGYMDATYYYLLPEASYVAVCEVYTKKTQGFPLTQRMLHKQMRDDGLIVPDAAGGKCARNKTINGKAQRLLWIPRANIDGPRVVNEQTQMNLVEVDPNDEDLPFK